MTGAGYDTAWKLQNGISDGSTRSLGCDPSLTNQSGKRKGHAVHGRSLVGRSVVRVSKPKLLLHGRFDVLDRV
jgi:hypothetical protein